MAKKKAFRRFSGDSDDAGKQLKRWKLWCQAKMMTVKDLQKTQRGPWVHTLLAGSALECVEHLKLEEMSAENGEDKLWEVLHGRFLKRNRPIFWEKAWGRFLVWPPKMANPQQNG